MGTYKRVFMVNLLSMGKRGQKLLTEEIELHIKSEEHQQLKYLYYDFHHIVKGKAAQIQETTLTKLTK